MDDEAKSLVLGTIKLDKDGFLYLPERVARISLRPRQRFAIVVAYDYVEPSHLKDDVTLRLEADLDGQPLGADEEIIEDTPSLPDDARGHLRVEGTARSSGRATGRYRIEAVHTASEWDGTDPRSRRLKHAGEFTLEIG